MEEEKDLDDLIQPRLSAQVFLGEHFLRKRFAPLYSERMELFRSMPPSHLALPFPYMLRMQILGNRVMATRSRFGFLHRGLEKCFENVSWLDGADVARQLNPRFSEVYAISYLQAVERIFKIHARLPPFAMVWRTLILECAHAAHHMRVINKVVQILVSSFLAEQSRTRYVSIKEIYQRAAFQKGEPVSRLGGIVFESVHDLISNLRDALLAEQEAYQSFKIEVAREAEIQRRLSNMMMISQELALSYGLSGITLRACGHLLDLRREDPYLFYPSLSLEPVSIESGDAWSRFCLRLNEVEQSLELCIKLIEQAFKEVNSQALSVNLQEVDLANPPKGTETVGLEALEGAIWLTAVSGGQPRPHRVRIKTPSFAIASALRVLLMNLQVSDVPLALHSLGMEGYEIDR